MRARLYFGPFYYYYFFFGSIRKEGGGFVRMKITFEPTEEALWKMAHNLHDGSVSIGWVIGFPQVPPAATRLSKAKLNDVSHCTCDYIFGACYGQLLVNDECVWHNDYRDDRRNGKSPSLMVDNWCYLNNKFCI